MAGARERNGRWLAYYKLNGKQKGAGTYDTYEEAIEAARRAEANRPGKDEVPAKVSGKLTVAGYFPTFIDGHKMRDTTRDNYTRMGKHIIRHLGSIPLVELVPASVRTFARKLEASTLSPVYVERIVALLGTMCKTAVADGFMPSNPCETVRAGDKNGHREMRILTKAEFRSIYRMMHTHYQDLIETLVTTGMRWGEAIALKTDAIVRQGKVWVIRVKRTISEIGREFAIRDFGKTSTAMRDISVPETLARRLIARANADGFVFTTVRDGLHLHRNEFRREFRKAQIWSGTDPDKCVRVHDLRHSAISWWVAAGIPLEEVRDRAGHANLSTTSKYVHTIKRPDDPFVSNWAAIAA